MHSSSRKLLKIFILSLIRVQYPSCAYGPYFYLNLSVNGVNILVEVSCYINIVIISIPDEELFSET